MSAMPERVLAYVSVFGTYSQIKDEYHDVECILVPESRLLAAEARVREVEAAFKKYGDHWGQCPAITPRRKCNCGYDQARAILAREGA